MEVQDKEEVEFWNDCRTQLDTALPGLLRASKMMAKLNKKMIDEMKQTRNPPSGMKLVMEAVCIMKRERDDEQGPEGGEEAGPAGNRAAKGETSRDRAAEAGDLAAEGAHCDARCTDP
jgi:hypothetical protein